MRRGLPCAEVTRCGGYFRCGVCLLVRSLSPQGQSKVTESPTGAKSTLGAENSQGHLPSHFPPSVRKCRGYLRVRSLPPQGYHKVNLPSHFPPSVRKCRGYLRVRSLPPQGYHKVNLAPFPLPHTRSQFLVGFQSTLPTLPQCGGRHLSCGGTLPLYSVAKTKEKPRTGAALPLYTL